MLDGEQHGPTAPWRRPIGCHVRLTVTPLGATGRSAAGVAAAVVDYLEGNEGDRGTALVASESNGLIGTGRYYADSIEGPGRWLGSGAGFHGLSGVVDRESFRSVLEGRHPMTGERLVTARGSSQRSHLAVGTVARFDGQGRPLYTLADAASLLGMSRSEIDDLVAAGQPDAGAHWLADRRVAASGARRLVQDYHSR